MRQALAGMLWSKQFYYFDADRWLAEHHAHPLHLGSQKISKLESGSTWSMRTSSRCRTNGNTPGTRLGTWPSTHCRFRSSTPTSRKQQMLLMVQGVIPASQRTDARLRMEFQRREPSGPRLCHPVPPSHRARVVSGEADVEFLKSAFKQAVAELYLVGEPEGPIRQKRV